MADETLRMQAEVVDRFSGPLKSLRAQLLDVSRQGASHGETLAKGMGKAEAAIQSTARSATTVLNPALATVGVTGLTAGAAVAGVAMSLSKLSSNLSSLGALSRETGVAAGTLQTFGAVARKFGLEQDAVAAGTKTFAGNMREFSRGIGDTYQWINRQGTDAAGRKAFQDFAQDIRGTTDEGEKLRKSLTFMESIKNPIERGIFAQHVFGNSDFGRLADEHLGKIADVWSAQKERLGPLDPKAILQAEKFEQAIADLRTSMQTIGTTIAKEVLPFASEFTQWIDGIAKDQRGDFVKGLRGGLQDISRELRAIDWKGAGDSAKEMLLATTALVKPLADDIKEIAAAIRSFGEGKYVESFRHLDGGSGPLARRLAPMKGDDEIAAQEDVDRLRKLRDVAKEASDHLIGRTQQRMGLIDTPEAAQQKLTAAEAELNRLKARTPEQRDRDFKESSEKLRRSIDGLSETIKQQQGATKQNSSAEGDSPFAGARVQTAAFGGGGGFGRLSGLGRGANLPGGGSGPGYVGEAGPAGPGAGRGFGGGRLNGLGRAAPRVPPASMPPGATGGVPTGSDAGNLTALIEREARAAGVDPRIMFGIRAGESGKRQNRNNPDAAYDKKDDALESSWGPFQLNRRRGLGVQFEKETGLDVRDRNTIPDQVRWVARGLAKNGRRWLRNWMGYHGDRDADPRWGDSGYVPQGGGRTARLPSASSGDFLPNGAPRVLKPNSMKDAPGITMEEADRLRSGKADGEAWAAREKARKAFEAMRQGEGRLDASAGRAGIVATPKVENNGSVVVNVQKAGPDARVTTSATGNLFRDVVQNHGRQMAKAD
ncbi:hypothetical protein SAMN02799622_03532 [Methylobacterium sp. UNC378MF]|uniref:hypothetical protein n=1 Tax=Methylobacterium sp. UNC378MF TaxID=1502748 RepID=UPI000885BD7A|nr:hypothetical protein [Methylobacterium sp. UNC378MF]SDA25008.1 hypothetical protein SAMN02799622_03532 [Methylobacterium sp. UNC378MF]